MKEKDKGNLTSGDEHKVEFWAEDLLLAFWEESHEAQHQGRGCYTLFSSPQWKGGGGALSQTHQAPKRQSWL